MFCEIGYLGIAAPVAFVIVIIFNTIMVKFYNQYSCKASGQLVQKRKSLCRDILFISMFSIRIVNVKS